MANVTKLVISGVTYDVADMKLRDQVAAADIDNRLNSLESGLDDSMTAMRNSIVAKGGSINEDTPLSQYAEAINTIPEAEEVDFSPVTASGSDIRAGKSILTDADTVVSGELPTNTSASINVLENTVNVPAGIYDEPVTKTVGTFVTPEVVTPGTSNKIIAQAGSYLGTDAAVLGDVNLVSDNIKHGVTIFGVSGNYEGEGADCQFGYINDSGLFQAVDLSGSVVENSGEPQNITLYMFKLSSGGDTPSEPDTPTDPDTPTEPDTPTGGEYAFTATGAGTASVNGDYYATGQTMNDNPVYTNGTVYLYRGNAQWVIDSDVNHANDYLYYNPNSTEDIIGNWEVGIDLGDYPGPVIAAYSGSQGGDNSGSGEDRTYVYTVSGAGDADANGNYYDSGTTTSAGQHIYTNDKCTLYLEVSDSGGHNWNIERSADGQNLYITYTIGEPTMSSHTWGVAYGAAPAPTVTEYSGDSGSGDGNDDDGYYRIRVEGDDVPPTFLGYYSKTNTTTSDGGEIWKNPDAIYLFYTGGYWRLGAAYDDPGTFYSTQIASDVWMQVGSETVVDAKTVKIYGGFS